MVKHTPGPWKYTGVSKLPRVRVAAWEGDDTCAGLLIADCANSHLSTEEQVANARLIAEAPKMLAMLKEVRDYYLDRMRSNSQESLLRIIARAEGSDVARPVCEGDKK